jgi:catechol 2,3-dioxygenase-like lactoylglutathione lyase family enzyme
VLLLVRDVSRSAEFYEKGLGLPLIRSSERWAELSMGSAVLALKQAKG